MGGEMGGWVDTVVRRAVARERRKICRNFGDCD